MTVSSYHARPIASTEFRFKPGGTVPCLSHPRAVSCPVPASLKSLLFPRFLFSKARCLLAAGVGTGGSFRLSESFQTLTCTVSLHRLHRCRRGGPLVLQRRVMRKHAQVFFFSYGPFIMGDSHSFVASFKIRPRVTL